MPSQFNPYGYYWDPPQVFREGVPLNMDWTLPNSDPRYFGYRDDHPGRGDGMGDWGYGDEYEVDYGDLFPGAFHGIKSKSSVVTSSCIFADLIIIQNSGLGRDRLERYPGYEDQERYRDLRDLGFRDNSNGPPLDWMDEGQDVSEWYRFPFPGPGENLWAQGTKVC